MLSFTLKVSVENKLRLVQDRALKFYDVAFQMKKKKIYISELQCVRELVFIKSV